MTLCPTCGKEILAQDRPSTGAMTRRLIRETIQSNARTASILSEIAPDAGAIIRICARAARRLRELRSADITTGTRQ